MTQNPAVPNPLPSSPTQTVPPPPLPLDKYGNQYNNGFMQKIKYPVAVALIIASAGGGFLLGQSSNEGFS